MAKSQTSHTDQIAITLRNLISVQTPSENELVARPDFWQRCHIINPNWVSENIFPSAKTRIYVDGHLGACKYNSFNVLKSGLEPDLEIYQGYALGGGAWATHAWCMRGDRIIETCGEFTIYFGAKLTDSEIEFMEVGCTTYRPLDHSQHFWTVYRGNRVIADYVGDNGAEGMFRERDLDDRHILDGIGRWE